MGAARTRGAPGWQHLRLRDRLGPGLRVLFVGINPGVRSALTGHHFAGYSNRFWKLLFDSGLVPERIGCEDDVRLPEWGYGLTNLVPRPSPGISDLTPADYARGRRRLEAKVRRCRPEIVALVGVTLFRALVGPSRRQVSLGPQPERLAGAEIHVLPNPSGRNANFTYRQMLAAFEGLRTRLEKREP